MALAAIAEKKYPGDSDAMRRLELKILEGHGPAVSGVTVSFIGQYNAM